MSTSLIEWLKTLPEGIWSPHGDGSEALVQELEQDYSLTLPDDYRDLLVQDNGGTFQGPNSHVHLEPADVLQWHNEDEAFEEYIPGMFVIGDDGGGSVFYLDPDDRLSLGAYAVFLVPLGSLAFADSIHVGPDLKAVFEKVLAGVSFHDDLPRYGREP